MIKKIGKNLFHLGKADAVAKITPTIDAATKQGVKTAFKGESGIEWIPWGAEDNRAIEMLRLCWGSPTKPRLMDQAKEFILGAGVKLMTVDVDENGKEVKRLVKESSMTSKIESAPAFGLKKWFRYKQVFSSYLELAALSLSFAEIAFVRFSILDNGQVELQTIQPNKVRFAKPKPGKPLERVLINPYFGMGKTIRKEDTVSIPIFDRENPNAWPESVIVLRKAQIGTDFYTQGLWWGTETWTRVDNLTPEYHLSGLMNGYNAKLLIEIDDSYFVMEGEDVNDEKVMDEIEQRKDLFMAKLDDYLAGVKNTDKALVLIGGLMDAAGKEKKLIRITPIENKMTDDAYMNLIREAGAKQAQGHGVLPSLAGISDGNKLGGSGSELQHSVMYQVRYMTPSYRRLLKEPLDYALEVMGYNLEEGEYHFTDIEMTTLDKNPTGQQAAVTNT